MPTSEPAFVVKVCGVTSAEDVEVAVGAGANAVGFNFYPKSPRYIPLETAADLHTPGGCLRVGVFVNASESELEHAAVVARLDVLQLHGSVHQVPSGIRIWRSIPAGFETPPADDRVEAYLVDSATPHYGGSGQTFDWTVVKNFPFRMIVAGGLLPENVADAIATLRPWGVDACSRLEFAPGKKDADRVRAFVAAAWRARN